MKFNVVAASTGVPGFLGEWVSLVVSNNEAAALAVGSTARAAAERAKVIAAALEAAEAGGPLAAKETAFPGKAVLERWRRLFGGDVTKAKTRLNEQRPTHVSEKGSET